MMPRFIPVQGNMYRIRYKSDTQKVEREAVMLYLGRSGTTESTWSARPVAGTQALPDHWVISIEPVDQGTTPYLNRKV